MSLKLKALGLSLIAAMAVSAVAVLNAAALPVDPINNPGESGHFTSKAGVTHVHVKGFAGPETEHNLHLFDHEVAGEIGCAEQSYTATTTSETSVSITVSATYGGCTTTSNGQAVTVTMNGCTYTFTVQKETDDTKEQTAHLVCPTEKTVEIHHPSCTTTIHGQTPTGKLTYTTKGSGETHEITLDVDVTFKTTRHGLCQFVVPTEGFGTLSGSATVKGFDTLENQIPITAT